MMRAFYRLMILLHPPAFRRRFADEMLWIFEEGTREGGAAGFFADGLASLGKQWVTNRAVWTIAAIVLGNLPFLVFAFFPHRAPARNAVPPTLMPVFFVVAVLGLLVTISTCLIFAVTWFRFVQRRRA
jgi:hypothetical protein